MKPEERQKKMEKNGWRVHKKWFWQERTVMVRIGLDQKPEYATIFPNGKLRYGDHSPVVFSIRGDSGCEHPAQYSSDEWEAA